MGLLRGSRHRAQPARWPDHAAPQRCPVRHRCLTLRGIAAPPTLSRQVGQSARPPRITSAGPAITTVSRCMEWLREPCCRGEPSPPVRPPRTIDAGGTHDRRLGLYGVVARVSPLHEARPPVPPAPPVPVAPSTAVSGCMGSLRASRRRARLPTPTTPTGAGLAIALPRRATAPSVSPAPAKGNPSGGHRSGAQPILRLVARRAAAQHISVGHPAGSPGPRGASPRCARAHCGQKPPPVKAAGPVR